MIINYEQILLSDIKNFIVLYGIILMESSSFLYDDQNYLLSSDYFC